MKRIPTKEAVLELIERQQRQLGPLVSIYMPTHVESSPDHIRSDQIRYKNKLQKLKKELDEQLQNDSGLQAAFDKLDALHDDIDFWQHRSNGLALFSSDDGISWFDLPVEVDELVIADEKYILWPLIMATNMFESSYILSVNIGQPSLFRVSMTDLVDITPQSMPKDLRSALKITDYEQEQQFHSVQSGGDAAQYHGQGASKDHRDEDTIEYLRLVDSAVSSSIHPTDPLILAGTNEQQSLFRQVSKHQKFVDETIEGNYEKSSHELHKRAKNYLFDKIKRDLKSFNEEAELAGNQKKYVKSQPEALLEAAHRGQIQTVALQLLKNTRDKVDESMKIMPRIEMPINMEFLSQIEHLTQMVYRQNGQVLGIFRDKSGHNHVKAILRYLT